MYNIIFLGDNQYIYVCYRSFKLPLGVVRQACRATYNGEIPECENKLTFDLFTTFETGKFMVVDGELAAILQQSRYAPYFTFEKLQDGDRLETKVRIYIHI